MINPPFWIGSTMNPEVRQKENLIQDTTVVGEEEVIRRAQTDPSAFKPLYEKYFRKIVLFIHRRVNDKELAIDITQQAFYKALLHIGRFRFRGLPFSSWLYRIAINECNDYFRKKSKVRWVALEPELAGHLFDEMTADTTRDDWERKMPVILQQLKPNELMLIELRFFEGKAFREIAEILDTSEVNAKTKTYRILQKMKKMFMA